MKLDITTILFGVFVQLDVAYLYLISYGCHVQFHDFLMHLV